MGKTYVLHKRADGFFHNPEFGIYAGPNNQFTTGEMRREKVVKNLGEMFGDFDKSFRREVTIDRENEQCKDRENLS